MAAEVEEVPLVEVEVDEVFVEVEVDESFVEVEVSVEESVPVEVDADVSVFPASLLTSGFESVVCVWVDVAGFVSVAEEESPVSVVPVSVFNCVLVAD